MFKDLKSSNFLVILFIISGGLVVWKLYSFLFPNQDAGYNKVDLVDSGGSVKGFDPKPVTDRVFDAIKGITSSNTKDIISKELLALNDNQLILVYNDWNRRYSGHENILFSKYGTLTQALKDESGYFSLFGDNYLKLIIDRLERLKLN